MCKDTKEIIRQLRIFSIMHKYDQVGVNETNWAMLCRDAADIIEDLTREKEKNDG